MRDSVKEFVVCAIGIIVLGFIALYFLTGCSVDVEPMYAYDRIKVHRNEQSDAWINLELRPGYLVRDYVVDYETMTVTLNLERTEELK